MSEYFKGVTFANQHLSPADDAVIRRRLIADGVLTGCEISHTRDTLSMAPGYLMACGRQIQHPSAEDWKVTYSPATSKTASGTVIALSDASSGPLQGLQIYGRTTQDGTPTPEAPVELVSVGDGGSVGVTVAGKNIVTGITNGNRAKNYAPALYAQVDSLVPDTDYFISFTGASGHMCYSNENLFNITAFTCTGSRQAVLLRTKKSISKDDLNCYNPEYGWFIFKNNVGNTVVPSFSDVQIEFGTAMTDYEAPVPYQTLPVSTPNGLPGILVDSGGNYTDADGQQWICDEVDFARGVYVQRIQSVTLTGAEGVKQFATVTGAFQLDVLGGVHTPGYEEVPTYIMCNYYQPRTRKSLAEKAEIGVGIANKNGLIIYDDTLSTATMLKNKLAELYNAGNPVKVLVILETPVETPIPADELAAYAALHTNKPNTTIYNDAGAHMDVGYYPKDDTIPSNGYARVLLTVDLTRTATADVFDQVNTSIEYADTEDGFTAPVQDDINNGCSVYQLPLAVVSIGDGTITGITDSIGNAEPI